MAIKTIENIIKGQELFADYGYSFQISPRWYRNLFRQHADEKPSERNLKRLYQLNEAEKCVYGNVEIIEKTKA